MLTPVDLQQKKFKIGLGYDKNDVQSFFEEVSQSYVELYRANADLKDQLITLTDTVQHYKAQEDNLQKSLLLAEKNSEESKTAAEKAFRRFPYYARKVVVNSRDAYELEPCEKPITVTPDDHIVRLGSAETNDLLFAITYEGKTSNLISLTISAGDVGLCGG